MSRGKFRQRHPAHIGCAAVRFRHIVSTHATAALIVTHGPVEVRDIAMLPASFNSRFPASKFEVFVYSNAFTIGELQLCHAVVGVSPRGSLQFPRNHYIMTETKPGKSMTVGERRKFALDCVTEAIRNMLSDDLEEVYKPYPVEWSK